jgi:hypothetical protein
MKIVSYYTDGHYKKVFERLDNSAKRFGHTIDVVFEPKADTWEKAIRYKPLFLSRMFQKYHDDSILYLDADCEIIKDISQLNYLVDLRDIHIRRRDLEDKFNCGVILFRNTGWLLPFIKTWRKLTNVEGYNSITVDQKPFEKALLIHHDITVGQLPYLYNFLPHDHLEYSKDDAVIVHHKESKTGVKARNWRNTFRRKNKNV